MDEHGEVLGDVGWHWQRRRHGPNAASDCVMIGVELLPAHRGRGIGGPVQAELVRLLFAHTTVHRVEASTDVENLAEQRALEKAGFVREGVARGAQWRDGAFHDVVTYAVLRGDPLPGGSSTAGRR